MLDWLIIGGGIHGVYLALVLTARGGVAPERLRILDPHPQLMARWNECTASTGMVYLRSSRVHHLGLDPRDLLVYARRQGERAGQFFGPYGRPSLELFRDHCAALIAEHGLDHLHIAGRALGLARVSGGWRIETSAGGLEARRVLLALSVSEQLRWPVWSTALREIGAPIHHLYEQGFQHAALPPVEHCVVLGGGISAAQTALGLARRSPASVTLLLRHPIREAKFDSEPCWLGPACMARFEAEPDLRKRRAMIKGARNPGTMPDDVARALRRAVRWGLLTVHQGEVTRARRADDGSVVLDLADGATLRAERVLLATGFAQQRPGGPWLDAAIGTHGLPLAPCAYPQVDRALRWAEGLYVTGALAELELGPAARNIAGARHAGERFARLRG